MAKLNIVFIHSNISQFKKLHIYLNESGLANSFLICSKHNYNKHHKDIVNLFPFSPYGNKLKSPGSFYYLTRVEGSNRRSLGILQTIRKIQTNNKIDLIVGHITAGSPSMFFDELDIPIITYIEFPSFRAHQWDPKYPPTETKRFRDKNFEMLSYYSVIKSNHVIVPSEYSRNMFPEQLRQNISVQMEGFAFNDDNYQQYLEKEPGITYIGFVARDLSSAKGFEQFIKIAKEIIRQRDKVKFVVIGSPECLYSYEGEFLEKIYGKNHNKTFKDYVLSKEKTDLSYFTFTGLLKYEKYSSLIHDIDFFLYPIQFSSAAWSLHELIGRGKIVIASNRCYVPEIIKDKKNGFLCDYENRGQWVEKSIELIDHKENFQYIAENAKQTSKNYHIKNIALSYLELFNKILDQ